MGSAARILVIEDFDLLRTAVVRLLEHRGYEAEGAADGQAGLESMERQLPDLVLCDLRMPRLDGLGVLAAVKSRWPELPIIVMSGEGLLDDAIAALRLGAWDFITKPFADEAVVQHAVQQALERHSLLAENKAQRQRLESVNLQLAASLGQLKEDEEAGRQLQVGLLPANGTRFGSFTLTREFLPSVYLSGDFLDAFTLDAHRWVFYLADVAGHGVPSALVTVMLRTLVERQARTAGPDEASPLCPGAFLTQLNEAFTAMALDKHVALFLGVVDETAGTLTWANAGFYPWPLLVAEGRAVAQELPGYPLGMMPKATYAPRRCELSRDFAVVAFTDGLLEIMPGTSVEDRLERAHAAAAQGGTAAAFLSTLGVDRQAPRPDDVAVLVLSRGGPHALRAS